MPLVMVKLKIYETGVPNNIGTKGNTHERLNFMKPSYLYRKWGAFVDETNIAALQSTLNTEMVSLSTGDDP